MIMTRSVNLLRNWAKDKSGVAAIEFGLLGPIFIALLCGVMFFGTYLYNANRVDSTTFNAARQVMLINKPTIATVQAEVDQAFADLNMAGTTATVSIGQRDDGGSEAIISAAYTMVDPTAFLNSEGFTHQVEYRVPLWEN